MNHDIPEMNAPAPAVSFLRKGLGRQGAWNYSRLLHGQSLSKIVSLEERFKAIFD